MPLSTYVPRVVEDVRFVCSSPSNELQRISALLRHTLARHPCVHSCSKSAFGRVYSEDIDPSFARSWDKTARAILEIQIFCSNACIQAVGFVYTYVVVSWSFSMPYLFNLVVFGAQRKVCDRCPARLPVEPDQQRLKTARVAVPIPNRNLRPLCPSLSLPSSFRITSRRCFGPWR